MIRRTAAITAASIAGVIIAGGAAAGANIGILNAADDNPFGDLSADMTTTTTDRDTTALLEAITDGSDTTQQFTVDDGGTVAVEPSETGIDLRWVHPNEGWSWRENSAGADVVSITFTAESDTLLFTATSNDDGTIGARVDRPIVDLDGSQSSSGSDSSGYDDDDGDHDEEHEDDGHEEDEHEGRDDDD